MKKFLILLTMLGSVFAGDEFLVNSSLDSTQRDGQIEWINNDMYAVVWNTVSADDAGDIVLQFFDDQDQKIGDEIIVNQYTAGEQEKVALAANGKDRFIVTWTSHNGMDSIYDIKARIYNDGSFSDEILVNSTTQFSQTNPSAAIDPAGNIIVCWESWYQDGSDRGVYAQRFNTKGDKDGIEFQLNTHTAYSQARPAVKFFDDGRFVACWESWNQESQARLGYGLVGQLFAADGSKIGSEFGINTQTNDYQWFGDMTTLPNGRFFVAWCSWQQDGDKGGIFLQKFDKNGQKIGNETQVNETTHHYQWLPRIKTINEDHFAVVWSSWMQDGSREGIAAQVFDTSGVKRSFEMPVNLYGDSFQWEPDFIPTRQNNELLVTWSSWGQYDQDYEIMARRIQPIFPIGFFDPYDYTHAAGRSTFGFTVHVVDSSLLTNSEYEMRFSDIKTEQATVSIENISTEQEVVSNFKIDKGEKAFYITSPFEGIAVEFEAIFNFDYNFDKSGFINNSGTDLIFGFRQPTLGIFKLAPIDVALIWGVTDTSNGQYIQPVDTANGYYGSVPLPFKAWNLTDDEPMEVFVAEDNKLVNNFWEPTERIVLLTPEQYRDSGNNTHVEISSAISNEIFLMPAPGDTQFVFTNRPLAEEDVYRFTTDRSYISAIEKNSLNTPEHFSLEPNYPNPFNPTTTLRYSVPSYGNVKLDVYNILGQKVATLINKKQMSGTYRVLFNGSNLVSGTYFAIIRFKNRVKVHKMLLIK